MTCRRDPGQQRWSARAVGSADTWRPECTLSFSVHVLPAAFDVVTFTDVLLAVDGKDFW